MTPVQLPGMSMPAVTQPFVQQIVGSGSTFRVVLKDGRTLTGTIDIGARHDFEMTTTDTLHQELHEFNISDIKEMHEL